MVYIEDVFWCFIRCGEHDNALSQIFAKSLKVFWNFQLIQKKSKKDSKKKYSNFIGWKNFLKNEKKRPKILYNAERSISQSIERFQFRHYFTVVEIS